MRQVLIEMCGEADRAAALGLAAPVPMDVCLEANIHFPVDWVLLRDGARTPSARLAAPRAIGAGISSHLLQRVADPRAH